MQIVYKLYRTFTVSNISGTLFSEEGSDPPTPYLRPGKIFSFLFNKVQ